MLVLNVFAAWSPKWSQEYFGILVFDVFAASSRNYIAPRCLSGFRYKNFGRQFRVSLPFGSSVQKSRKAMRPSPWVSLPFGSSVQRFRKAVSGFAAFQDFCAKISNGSAVYAVKWLPFGIFTQKQRKAALTLLPLGILSQKLRRAAFLLPLGSSP